jgi:hypothetical protein
MKTLPLLVTLLLALSACTPAASPQQPAPQPEVPAVISPSPALPTPPTPAPTLAPTDEPATQPAAPTPTAPAPAPTTPTPTPTPAAVAQPTPLPEEAILILEPGPGSTLTSPLRVSGFADSTFEQNLVIRLLDEDGEILAQQPTTIQSELGQRGPFSAEIPFNVPVERQAFLQVYTESPRDGQITHLHTVGVRLSPTGPAEIRTAQPSMERIIIFTPLPGQAVAGGSLHVEGFALASFEQHLLVELYDEDGSRLAYTPVTVQAPDLGFPGPFRASLSYQVSQEQAGRLVVRDPSVAFPGDVHISSVELRLQR